MKLYNVLRLLRQAGLAALLMVGWAGAAHAQKVLILQADESTSGDPYGAGNIQTNLRNEFSNAGATVTVQSVLTTPGAVTASTFSTAPGPGAGASPSTSWKSCALFTPTVLCSPASTRRS